MLAENMTAEKIERIGNNLDKSRLFPILRFFRFKFPFPSGTIASEGEIDAKEDVGVRVEGDSLLGEFAERVVHAQEHIEASRMEVQHPAETCPVSAGHAVDISREKLEGLPVGRQTELGRRHRTGETG